MNSDNFESYINNLIDSKYSGLAESMQYSLGSGGKRIRPTLTVLFAQMCGLEETKAYPVAAAIEMIHTYSLIHDDLPCMDNDTIRRGKPTNHVVFGECTATLAGDALQPLAFEILTSADICDSFKVKCVEILSQAAGYKGMCGGQFLDMSFKGVQLDAEQLTEINRLKTGALISAACKLGVACSTDDRAKLNAAEEFGYLLGLAFQIRDDILDAGEEGKNTYMVLLGAEKCNEMVHELTSEAIDRLSVFDNTEALIEMVKKLENRVF